MSIDYEERFRGSPDRATAAKFILNNIGERFNFRELTEKIQGLNYSTEHMDLSDVENTARALDEGSLDFKIGSKIFDTAREAVNYAERQGVEISEQVAARRGLSQVRAGGEYELDRNIDDFDDLLAAVGPQNVQVVPENFEGSLPGPEPSGGSSGNADDPNIEAVAKPILAVAGILGGISLLGFLAAGLSGDRSEK